MKPRVGEPYDLAYDQLVVALGSVARTLPIPGLADQGIGFKQVEEAIALRNHVLDRLDVAASTPDEAGPTARAELRRRRRRVRRRGGARRTSGHGQGRPALLPVSEAAHMRWVLVEATDRILPEVGADMGAYTVEELRRHGIEVRLETRLESCVDGHVVLTDGTEFDTDTLIWTAGVKAHPLARSQ